MRRHPTLDDVDPAVALFRALVGVGLKLRTLMDQRLADLGLTTQQAAVLTFLETAGEPLTLGVLADQLGCTHQNARQLVDALERKGFVAVRVDPADRRARRVSLTDRVAEVFTERNPQDHAAVRAWFQGLSDAEIEVLVGSLERVWRSLPR